MSEMEGMDETARMVTNAMREVATMVGEGIDRFASQAEGRNIESGALAEQRDLHAEGTAALSGPGHEYRAGDALPPQAQSDEPWPFGKPDAPDFPGSFTWADLGPETRKTT